MASYVDLSGKVALRNTDASDRLNEVFVVKFDPTFSVSDPWLARRDPKV